MFKCCHARTLHPQSGTIYLILEIKTRWRQQWRVTLNVCGSMIEYDVSMYYWCRRKSTRSYLFNKVGLATGVLRGIPRRRQLFILLGYPVDRVNKLAVIKVQRQISYDNWTVRDPVHTSVYMWHSFQLETVVARRKTRRSVLAYVLNFCKKCVY